MKYLGIAALAALVLTAGPASQGVTYNWTGNPGPSGTWLASDPTVWSPNTGYPGKAGQQQDQAWIHNGGTVTINTDLTGMWPDILNVYGSSTLIVTSGGKVNANLFSIQTTGGAGHLTVTGTGQIVVGKNGSALTLSSDSKIDSSTASITVQGFTVNNAAVFTQTNGTVATSARDFNVGSGTAGTYSLAAGSLTVGFDRGYDTWVGGTSGGKGTFNQTGGSATLRVLHVGLTGDGAQYTISGGSLTTSAMVIGGDLYYTGGVGTFKVVGSSATSIVANENVYNNPSRALSDQTYQQTTRGTLQYVLDAGGATKIQVQAGAGWSGNVSLAGALNVDVTGYAEVGTINLMSYAGAVTGTFGPVTIQSFDAVAPPGNLLQPYTAVANPLLLPQGYYYLNYANSKNITLFFNVPEPATLSLLALGGLVCLRRRRS